MPAEEEVAALAEAIKEAEAATTDLGGPEVAALLERICADAAQQRETAKKQLFWTRLFAGSAAGMLAFLFVAGLWAAPKISAVMASADRALVQAGSVAANLEVVTDELAAADISGILKNIDALVRQGQSGIPAALNNIDRAIQILEKVDIEAVNRAIDDLRAVISPLSKASRFFGGDSSSSGPSSAP